METGKNSERREFICIGCPLGCSLTVETENGEVGTVTGNTCPRGRDYAVKEVTDPRRIVTSLVRVEGGRRPVVSVKTAADIPKERIMECIKILKEIQLKAPVHIGDLVVPDICGSGVDVVATASVAAMEEAVHTT